MTRHAFSKRSRRRVRTGGKGRPLPTSRGKRKWQDRKIALILEKRGIRLVGRRTRWDPRKSTRVRPVRSGAGPAGPSHEEVMRKLRQYMDAPSPASPAEHR